MATLRIYKAPSGQWSGQRVEDDVEGAAQRNMSGAAFLRVKKLKGSGIIAVAARHNKREIQAEAGAPGSIDSVRSGLNQTLAGPHAAADVAQLAKDLMNAAGVTRLRKDAVLALEIVFSLPAAHAIDDGAYFSDCAAWAGRYFGGVQNILSVDIHRDEAQPHCHVLLLPLTDGRMDGGRMLGGKQKLLVMQKQFHMDVAARYGLTKAPARLVGASKQDAVHKVLQVMRETNDSALKSAVWATMRDKIESDPGPFLLALDIAIAEPKKPLKTMAQIFTSPGKGPKSIDIAASKASKSIEFVPPEKRQSLCSVDFTPKPALRTTPNLPKPTAHPAFRRGGRDVATDAADTFIEPTRVDRDSDNSTDSFNAELGEFGPSPAAIDRLQKRIDADRAKPAQQAADRWVKSALAATGR